MISVSDLAKGVLLESLQKSGVPSNRGLRLKVSENGLVLETDQPTERDHVIHHKGAAIVIVDREMEQKLGDAVIDIKQAQAGSDLVFRRVDQSVANANPDGEPPPGKPS